MAALAQRERDFAVAKLGDSVRQLQRYLDQNDHTERVLTQKSDKVDIDREELLAKNYTYAEKSNTPLTDEALKEFIEPKIDEAVDVVEEAQLKLAELKEAKLKTLENQRKTQDKTKEDLELAAWKMKAESKEKLLYEMLDDMDRLFIDSPTINESQTAESFSSELAEKESDLYETWMQVKARISSEVDMVPVVRREEETQKQVTSRRLKAKQLVCKVKASEESRNQLESTSLTELNSTSSRVNHNVKLARMNPPKFSGSIRDFARFKSDFEKIVQTSYTDPVHQVYVMKKECLEGEALNLVRNLDSLSDIWDRLTDKYGGTLQIVDSVIKDVKGIEIPRSNQDQGLINMIETLERGVQDLTAIGKRGDIANEYTVKLIEDKLPRRVAIKWFEEVQKEEVRLASSLSSVASDTSQDRFEFLLPFLRKERKMTERIIQQAKDRDKDKEDDTRKGNKRGQGKQTVNLTKKNKNNCLMHPNSDHLTRRCTDFLKLTADDRAQLVKDLAACKFCLSLSHAGKEECPWESKWKPCGVDGCSEFHSRTLHGNKIFSMIVHATILPNAHVELRTLLLMQEISDGGGTAFVFWDNGSSISLVSRRYARKRKLKGIKVSYDLETVNSVVTPQHTILYEIPIVDRNGVSTSISAYEIESICDETAFFDEGVTKLFKNLSIKDVSRPKSKVDLLIGSDNINIHPTRIDCVDKLVLCKSLYGSGRVLGGRHHLIQGSDKHNAFAKMVAYGSPKNFRVEKNYRPRHFAFEKEYKTCIDFFTAENLGVNVPVRCNRCKRCRECSFEAHLLSQLDRDALNKIRANMWLDPKLKKWITKYPYLVDPEILENNEEQADALIFRTEKRLIKNNLVDSYCKQFEDSIKRGVYKEIPEAELKSYKGPVFYITHHEVYKEGSASTPIRIVSNASLKYKGVSLNDILMKGPNALADLYSVQLNFRTYLIAAVGDVSKMYHSVATTEIERHIRRVKWRGVNPNEKPKVYGTEVVQFGDKPAAAITAIAIKETADLFEYIDPEAADKIRNDSYVDDFATGASSTELVEKLTKNITEILAKANFHIPGFVKSGDTSKEILSLLGLGEIGRVLGVGWSPPRDEFSVIVRVNLSKKFKGARKEKDVPIEDIPKLIYIKITRSILLGVTNTIYDIYGFFVPITIEMKIVLRETYKKELNLGWNDDIPRELKQQWIDLLVLLKEAESLRFRRCISFPNSVGDPELIVFNDGSSLAMCAVAYIRWQLDNGEYATQLVAAKARVAPLERTTIPQVEMNSAVLAVRLANTIQRSCRSFNFKETTHIADSKCTIATLVKDSTALKEYMGNRASEVKTNSNPKKWFYTKSSKNISDIGTRTGSTIEDIKSDSEYHIGPGWLKEDKSKWPVSQDVGPEHIPEEELLKPKICAHAANTVPIIDISRFRSYDFLMRVTARILRIFERKSFRNSEPTPSSLEKAEKYWIRNSMKLTSEKVEKGHLESLRPKKDEDGIIVLSTRALKGMKTNYNQDKFPILVSSDPLARLWMRKVHFENHTGITKTVAKSRRNFWIVRARRVALTVKNSCYVCRLLDKDLAMQQMAPLPASRLAVSPPFHITSMDLCGPYLVKDMVKKRTTMKVWVFIATCAATRAIHIDVTESYSTDAILQTLRKFTSLRGCPGEIITDQGSQFVAASKDISDLTKEWDWSVVSSWAGSQKIRWHVVPAEAQHQNGLSESLIKSVKRSMAHVIGKSVLSFSELQLAVFEIANIINSRPIGIISGSDPDEPNALTPNDLLLGRSTNEVPQGPFNSDAKLTKRYIFVQSLVDDWWRRWYDSVLPSLVPDYKWRQRYRNVKIGDICLMRYKGIRSTYRLGRVIEVKQGEDGLVRSVRLQYKLPNETSFRHVDRAVQGIAVIVPIEEQG